MAVPARTMPGDRPRPNRVPTAAEEAILAEFERVAPSLPGNDNVAEARRAAIAAFERDGLPTRKVEAWHYTDLRTALREVPASADAPATDAVAPLADGIRAVDLARVEPFATGDVNVDGVATRLREGTLFVAPSRPFDTIGQINAAFANGGAAVEIAGGASMDAPIELQASAGNAQAHYRNAVSVGARASAVLIERHTDGDGLASTVTDLVVGEGAEVTYLVVQARGLSATHLGQLNASIGKGATLTVFVLQMGARVARQELNIDLLGEEATLRVRGVNLLADDRLADVTMVANHAVPHTTGDKVFRNVGTGRGRGVFQGQIKVSQIAQKTDANMACNTLLLSDDASFAAKPELEIFADDVVCGHGATVDDLDPTHVFYLMARGIPEAQARALLVKGFVDEMLDVVEHEALAERLEAMIDEWLETHA